VSDELTKALLLEELASEGAVAEALFASVTRGVPIVQALVESGAVTAEILGRYLARTEAPYLRQVAPLRELVERLPAGLCERLLAVPVRRDAITGTVDVVVADAGDPHPAKEFAFHLGAPVRLVRASAPAIDEALRRLKERSLKPSRPPENAPASRGGARDSASERARLGPPPLPAEIAAPPQVPPGQAPQGYAPPPYSIGTPAYGMAAHASQAIPSSQGMLSHGLPPSVRRPPPGAQAPAGHAPDDDRIYDSRPRAGEPQPVPRRGTLPPPDPGLRIDPRAYAMRDEAPEPEARQPSRGPGGERQVHVVPGRPATPRRMMSETPPWGTPMHNARTSPSDAPRSDLGSEIPIPLTRRTFAAVAGGTQRPPPLVDPAGSMLGEGYAVDAGHFREIVELDERARASEEPLHAAPQPPDPPAPPPDATAQLVAPVNAGLRIAHAPAAPPIQSFIPGPPPLPRGHALAQHEPAQPEPPQLPFAEIGGILAALRAAASRDEVLELVLTGARLVALKVALFVVKRGGYLGWACTPEFADRGALQAVLIPLESASVFDEAVREGLYLGAMRHDEVHAALLHVMGGASRDVAVVPIRVSGRTAVVVLADELGDTMLATRRLEELAHAAGEAFARIVRQRR
jgi:hypothetical protein